MDPIVFNSSTLNQVIRKINPRIEKYLSDLDQINQDIRELESYLKSNALHFFTSIDVSENDEDGSSLADTYLLWGHHTAGLRIYAVSGDDNHELNMSTAKPLTDASAIFRIRTYAALPRLVEDIVTNMDAYLTLYRPENNAPISRSTALLRRLEAAESGGTYK